MDKVDIRPTCLRGVARPKSEVSVDAAKYWFEHESVVNYEHLCASFAMAFSCLALFDSGHLQINTEDLSNVIAMSTGNSIYVASPLLCDPSQEPVGLEMKRIIGNIGKPGIAMLVPPLNLRVRAPDPTSWRLVAHDDFDGKSYDRFAQTSMQLSLSGREQGLRLQNYGLCDKQVILLESVISVYDRGKWIADVDVLRALRPNICRGCRGRGHSELCRNDSCSASTGRTIGEQPEFRKIAIDCWEELLEAPEDACVVRAHGNWIGRLAATCVAYQMGRHVSILPEDVCWKCVDKLNKDQQDVVFIS
ncbi:hypothetical protein AOQ84DRAFT_341618 [Glonium stellatum]|uniref:Uncharacterized protein n=1 Tax=Glonium stellatum TaxID=574774 RepID=A0A8E2F0B8_9PEZI|nr:hypothetical protein AOQ84DRAFT_341618 [Glonium stellatum]